MDAGVLQITVLKGPKHGETMVCKPGSDVRIGRVIKGNNFVVRDPGISQKHLCFQFVPEASRWFVSDLDSSNGTILNESKIRSLVPVPISDSDVIKIGEITELGVKIGPSELLVKKNEEEHGVVKGRGVSTRRGSARVGTNAKASSDPDFVPAAMDKTAQKGKVRSQRIEDAKENTDNGFKEKMVENRNSTVQVEEPDQSKGVQLRRNPRRGNSSRALKEIDMNYDTGVGIEAKRVHMEKNERKGKIIGAVNEEMGNKNTELLLENEDEDGDSECVIIRNEGKGFKANTIGSSSTEKEEQKGGKNVGLEGGLEANCEGGDHFEKMTLEQWFDSMEVFLPKVIHDQSQEIINILKEKARKFEEFIEAGGDVKK